MKSSLLDQRFFIDTNIVIYCFDRKASKKQSKAIEILDHALSSGLGVISHQVIQEFVSVALLKFKRSFSPERLILYIDEVLFPLWRAYPSREAFLSAIEMQDRYRISWWDSLIVSSALDSGCRVLVSEDFSSDMRFNALEVVNPFSG